MRNTNQKGFTLFEMMFALSILSISILGTLSVSVTTKALNDQTHKMSLASFAAAEKMDQILTGIKEEVNMQGEIISRETELGIDAYIDTEFTVPGIGNGVGEVEVNYLKGTNTNGETNVDVVAEITVRVYNSPKKQKKIMELVNMVNLIQ